MTMPPPPPGGYDPTQGGAPPPSSFPPPMPGGGMPPPPGGGYQNYGGYPGGPPPMPEKKSRTALWIILAVILLVIVVLPVGCFFLFWNAADEFADEIDDSISTDEGDFELSVDECDADEFGLVSVVYTLKNTSGTDREFSSIEIEIKDNDGVVIGTAYDSFITLDDGEETRRETTGSITGEAGDLTCEAGDVTSYDSDFNPFGD